MSFYVTTSLAFLGDVMLPIALTSVGAYFAYGFLVDLKVQAVADYPIAPCVEAWKNWAQRYYDLTSGDAPAGPLDFVASDKTLLSDLGSARYGQCLPGEKWKNPGPQPWLNDIQAEIDAPPGPNVRCMYKKPQAFMGKTPCSLYQTQLASNKASPCYMASIGNLSSMDLGNPSQLNAVCVATNIYENTTPNVGFPSFVGASPGADGVCQYTQMLLNKNLDRVIGTHTRKSDLNKWVNDANPYAAYFYDDSNKDMNLAVQGATNAWFPWQGSNKGTPVGYPATNGDIEAGVVFGNFQGGKDDKGIGQQGLRGSPCWSRNNCATRSCQVQNKAGTTFGIIESTPWNSFATFNGTKSVPYSFGFFGPGGKTSAVCN